MLDILGPDAVAEAVADDEGPVEALAAAEVPAIEEVYAVWKIAPEKWRWKVIKTRLKTGL